MVNLDKLKPCPFCGGEANAYCRKGRYGIFGYIACEYCGVETRKKKLNAYSVDDPGIFEQYAFEELVVMWNRRWSGCRTE